MFNVIPKKTLYLAIAMAVCTIMVRFIGHIVLPVYDDAFITFRYAKNLATGIGFVYNPHEWILGTTAPAFGLFVSLLYILHLPIPNTIVIMNIVFDLVIALITFYTITRIADTKTAILFGIFFSISPILIRICVGGMEENLFLLFSLAALYLFSQSAGKISIALASISFFLRPEGILTIFLILFLTFRQKNIKESLILFSVSVAIMTLPFLYLYNTYGSIISQSVIAKSQLIKQPIITTFTKLFLPDVVAAFLLFFAIWGIVSTFRKQRLLTLLFQWIGLYIAAYFFARPFIWSWYGEPIQYCIAVFSAFGVHDIVKRIPAFRKLNNSILSFGGSLIVIGVWIGIIYKEGESQVATKVYSKMETWSNGLQYPESNTILAGDIGVVGFYSNAYIYDAAGLITPQAQNAKSYIELVNRFQPQYLFLNSTRETIGLFNDSLKMRYQPIERFSKSGSNSLSLDSNDYPSGWVQDYMIFKRK